MAWLHKFVLSNHMQAFKSNPLFPANHVILLSCSIQSHASNILVFGFYIFQAALSFITNQMQERIYLIQLIPSSTLKYQNSNNTCTALYCIAGNIICVFVFTQKSVELKPSFSNILKCLSICDTLFLVGLPLLGHPFPYRGAFFRAPFSAFSNIIKCLSICDTLFLVGLPL